MDARRHEVYLQHPKYSVQGATKPILDVVLSSWSILHRGRAHTTALCQLVFQLSGNKARD